MSTLALVADVASWALILIGSLATVTGGIGVLRMPDVYTRMHAASMTETLGPGALIAGLIIQAGPTLVAVKLLMILAFLFFTSPTSTFALAHAAMTSGVEPLNRETGNGKPGAKTGENVS